VPPKQPTPKPSTPKAAAVPTNFALFQFSSADIAAEEGVKTIRALAERSKDLGFASAQEAASCSRGFGLPLVEAGARDIRAWLALPGMGVPPLVDTKRMAFAVIVGPTTNVRSSIVVLEVKPNEWRPVQYGDRNLTRSLLAAVNRPSGVAGATLVSVPSVHQYHLRQADGRFVPLVPVVGFAQGQPLANPKLFFEKILERLPADLDAGAPF
jgi:hypothetical protein